MTKEMAKESVIVHTDGSCKGNPGPGGWAAIISLNGEEKEICGGSLQTTNNRMELTAVIKAVEACHYPCDITIITDSTYVMMDKETWKKWSAKPNLPNRDLWDKLIYVGLRGKHDIHYQHVDGHSGDAYNERCDKLARKMADQYAKGEGKWFLTGDSTGIPFGV